MDNDKDTPAWMLCDEILTKAKDEMILEAIDILHEEINQHRVTIEGYTPILLDRSEEMERDLFLLKNLLSRREEIRQNYKRYTEEKEHKDPALVMRIEELKKFLMAVDGIDLLMKMSHVFETWSEEMGKYSRVRDPNELLAASTSNEERVSALKFVLSSSKFKENEPLSEEEISIMRFALNAIEKKGG